MKLSRRPAPICLLLLFLLSACGGSGPVGTTAAPGTTPATVDPASPAAGGGAGRGAPGASAGSATARPGATGGGGGGAGAPAPAPGSQSAGHATSGAGAPPGTNPDNGGLGSMSRAFLRPAPYGSIVVEAASVPGAAPSSAVENNLSSVLQKYSGKPVRHSDHGVPGKGSGGCWTLDELRAVATQQRTTHTGGGEASLFIAFLDGKYCDDANVLGLAFGASADVIFTQQVRALATPTISSDVFMESVTTHEVGHILGMVNIGYQSPVAHEDAAHPHHSTDQNSVMYYSIDQANLIQQFVSGPPTTFDSADEADLAGLRNGSL